VVGFKIKVKKGGESSQLCSDEVKDERRSGVREVGLEKWG